MRSSELEAEIGTIYDELAALHSRHVGQAKLWKDLANDERFHSRLLGALAAVMAVEGDDGPFLVEVPPALEKQRKKIEQAYRRVREGIDEDQALELMASLEQSELGRIYNEVFAMARPRLERFNRLLDHPDVSMGHGGGLDRAGIGQRVAVECRTGKQG
ncbi:MAG: hypothetical protein ACE5D3_02920 [Candidatus Binatia bacterium]